MTDSQKEISQEELQSLVEEFKPLIGLKVDWLSIPTTALGGFEPSQVAVIINTLLDAALPQIQLLSTSPENEEKLKHIGLAKAPREIGQREGYPDYIHKSGKRVELKGLFVDNPDLPLLRPPTQREPSARLKENITSENIDLEKDAIAVIAVRLEDIDGKCSPIIVDVGVFSAIECIRARDSRLLEHRGKWIDGVPSVLKSGMVSKKIKKGIELTDEDYEKDTNFGKLARIPYKPLQLFLFKHGAILKNPQ